MRLSQRDSEQVKAAYIIMVWDCVDDDLQYVLGSGVRTVGEVVGLVVNESFHEQ